MRDLRIDRKDLDAYVHLLMGIDAVAYAIEVEALGNWLEFLPPTEVEYDLTLGQGSCPILQSVMTVVS